AAPLRRRRRLARPTRSRERPRAGANQRVWLSSIGDIDAETWLTHVEPQCKVRKRPRASFSPLVPSLRSLDHSYQVREWGSYNAQRSKANFYRNNNLKSTING